MSRNLVERVEASENEQVCGPEIPDFCPFSVEVEPSQSLDNLRLSTANKSWSLSMKTTIPNVQSNMSRESEQTTQEEEFPLNEIDNELGMTIKRALSNHEKSPHGLVPISSDSESSSRDESADMEDTDDEHDDCRPVLVAPPSTPGCRTVKMKNNCSLSPRLTKTPVRLSPQQPPTQDTPGAPLNPLQPLKALNPGIPHDHGSHRQVHMKRSQQTTPQRQFVIKSDPNLHPSSNTSALATTNTSSAAATSSNCLYECFAIEDFTQFFCPATPKSTTIETTASTGMQCFPSYDVVSAQKPFGTIQSFWVSHPPLPRSRRENLFDSNLPRNRTHSQRRKHVRNLLDVWHGTGNRDISSGPISVDDFSFECKTLRRRKRTKSKQFRRQNYCYDSDPEDEVLGRRQRSLNLLRASLQVSTQGSQQQPRFQKFRPSPFTHLDTDEESASESEADHSSYESAQSRPQPLAPRNSGPKISFDFGKALEGIGKMDEGRGIVNDPDIDTSVHPSIAVSEPDDGAVAFDFGKDCNHNQNAGFSHRRNTSTTSLSTTGHSCFHTLKPSPVHEESSSSESSTTSSVSETILSKESHLRREDHHLPSYFKSQPTHWTEFHLLFSRTVDGETVKTRVHELSNVKFPLVWHPPAVSSIIKQSKLQTGNQSSKATKDASSIECPTAEKIASLSNNGVERCDMKNGKLNISSTSFPIAVHGMFEVGAHLEHLVVQPKFLWIPITQPNLEDDVNFYNRSNNENSRELFLSRSSAPQIELLSIIRVNKAGPDHLWDRNQYPYARLDRTCVVTTNDASHPTIVLEARSPEERDWLVFSIKLIVARLASIIITRDEDMLHEFFSPYSALMHLEDDDLFEAPDAETRQAQKDEFSRSSSPVTVKSDTSVTNVPASFVSKQESATHECGECIPNVCDSESLLLEGNDMIALDDDDDDDSYDSIFQDRDDRDQEGSIRARNSGACAILRRSLTTTSALVDHASQYSHDEEDMVRTLSY